MRLCLSAMSFLGLALVAGAGAADAAEDADQIWPQCSDHVYEIPVDQIIRPEQLTAREAEAALAWLREYQDDKVVGERTMIMDGHLLVLEGFALRTRMQYRLRRNGIDGREAFCNWITRNAMPE